MKVIGQQTPGKTSGLSLGKEMPQTPHEIRPVAVVAEDLALLIASHHHMMQHPRCVESRPTRHGEAYSTIRAIR
ncbi:MAG TPA: hypothetical protein VFN94_09135 [Nitrospiria bacterium]|nr:hypothetical protein [Nitrospiria bacterium]